MGHKYCAHIACPIALREFKRRKRRRTSSLEKVYLPQRLSAAAAAAGKDHVEDAVAERRDGLLFVDGDG